MGKVSTQEYEDFIVNNRIKVNKYLNVVLWFFMLTGPAIALGVKAGFFHDITYTTCLMISAVMAIDTPFGIHRNICPYGIKLSARLHVVFAYKHQDHMVSCSASFPAFM